MTLCCWTKCQCINRPPQKNNNNNSLPCRDLNPGRPGEDQMTYQCAAVLLSFTKYINTQIKIISHPSPGSEPGSLGAINRWPLRNATTPHIKSHFITRHYELKGKYTGFIGIKRIRKCLLLHILIWLQSILLKYHLLLFIWGHNLYWTENDWYCM